MSNKKRFLLLTIIISIVMALILIKVISKKINPTLYRYANIEVKRLTNSIVVKHTKKTIEDKDLDDIFNIVKNNSDEIEVIEFNTKKINNLLSEIEYSLTKELVSIEEGKINDIVLPSTLKGINYRNIKKGIVCEIPIGILLNSDIMANLGTNIPIKLVYSGKVNTYIDNSIKEYGINNAYISIDLIVEVNGRIVMPTTSKEVVIKNKIPLLIRIINGKIPEFYQEGIKESSKIYSLPMKE